MSGVSIWGIWSLQLFSLWPLSNQFSSLHPTTLTLHRDKLPANTDLQPLSWPSASEGWARASALPHASPLSHLSKGQVQRQQKPRTPLCLQTYISHLGKDLKSEMSWWKIICYSSRTKTNQSHSSQDTSPLNSLQARSAADDIVSRFLNVT